MGMLHVLEHSKIAYFSKNVPNALLERENDRSGGQKSSLKELLATSRMADFSTVFILKPKFFCENHTRQKLFYISSYVKFLVIKIILITSLKQDPNMDFVPAISLLPIPTSSIISVVQLIQAKKIVKLQLGKHGNIQN